MGAVAALRTKIEAAIANDTGAGGLKEGPNGAANVQAVYYEKQAASDARSNITYSIEEQAQDSTNYDISLLSVTFTIFVVQDQVQTTVGSTGNYGYTRLEAIRDRLLTVLDGVTLAAQDSWTFSPMHYERRGSGPVGREQTRTVERYSVVANKARSVPSGVASGSIDTGVGFSVTGTLFAAGPRFGYTSGSGSTTAGLAFNVQAPFAYQIVQSIGKRTARRETGRYGRVAPRHKDCAIVLSFYPLVGSDPPMLPQGELQAFSLKSFNSAAYTLATGSTALVEQVGVSSDVDGSVSTGRYTITINGALTTTYGPP